MISKARAIVIGLLSVAAAAGADRPTVNDSDASLDVSWVEGELQLLLTSAAETLFALGGLPDDDARRQVLANGAALLGDASSLFHLPPAAACRLIETVVGGRVLDEAGLAVSHRPSQRLQELRQRDVPLGGRPPATPGPATASPDTGEADGHVGPPGLPAAEIVVQHRYQCQRADMLTQLGAQIFSAFPALQRLQARVYQGREPTHETLLQPQQPILQVPPPR